MRNIVNYTAGIYEVKDEWDSLLKVIVNNNIDYIKDIRKSNYSSKDLQVQSSQ